MKRMESRLFRGPVLVACCASAAMPDEMHTPFRRSASIVTRPKDWQFATAEHAFREPGQMEMNDEELQPRSDVFDRSDRSDLSTRARSADSNASFGVNVTVSWEAL